MLPACRVLPVLLAAVWLAACSTRSEVAPAAAPAGVASVNEAVASPAPSQRKDEAASVAPVDAPKPPPPPYYPAKPDGKAKEMAADRVMAPVSQPATLAVTGSAILHKRVGVAPNSPQSGASMAYVAGTPAPYAEPENRERYQHTERHGVVRVAETPVSTFSIDVDTGSYSNIRRMLNAGQLPPRDAVRVEELVNYFPYAYPLPQRAAPFAVTTELAPTPWNPDSLLLRIGIQAADPAKSSLPPANLVFLVDVSGSMEQPNKLPLLKQSLKMFVNQLRPQDHVSLVTYASGTAVVLEPTAGDRKAVIHAAIEQLRAGGSTAGAAGIELAYQMAEQGFEKQGINRILLATDGDFNVGISRFETLKDRVAEKRRSGVSLSTLGFGDGNYNEQLMEQLADAGDGAYSYIDNLNEAQKVLADEFTSTLATVARDVKIQLEFNPANVLEYRQIGFENRALKREDFSNDKVDAGEIGAGHRVTALYEIRLAGKPGQIEPLRYGSDKPLQSGMAQELGFLRLRYKAAHGEASQLMEFPVRRDAVKAEASEDFRFAAAVAAFGQRLGDDGKYLGKFDLSQIRALAANARGEDRFGYRGEFLRLVDLSMRVQQ
ncbi:VWA domain-containing protein [Chitinimonas arctica]|uniref:VWA domain-containing protein n=2 Tax=Chitinimonas arctica TaxID=2594795 RepID=A0A516SMD7_9NEIS|nr:VWA domain-containing protein [Chitinimonas arctica]